MGLSLYLWKELKLLVSAVNDYQASLNHVFSLAGMDFAANRVSSRMFRSFEKTCQLREVKPPERNLSLVLRSLTPLNIQPVVVVRALKRQQVAASTNFVRRFLFVLFYSFSRLLLSALNDLTGPSTGPLTPITYSNSIP